MIFCKVESRDLYTPSHSVLLSALVYFATIHFQAIQALLYG